MLFNPLTNFEQVRFCGRIPLRKVNNPLIETYQRYFFFCLTMHHQSELEMSPFHNSLPIYTETPDAKEQVLQAEIPSLRNWHFSFFKEQAPPAEKLSSPGASNTEASHTKQGQTQYISLAYIINTNC